MGDSSAPPQEAYPHGNSPLYELRSSSTATKKKKKGKIIIIIPPNMPQTTSFHEDQDLASPLLRAVKTRGGEPQKLCIDDMLQRHCGEFGVWQLRHFVLTSLAWALEAFHTMVMIFADQEPAWTCVSSRGCSVASTSVCGLDPGSWEWSGGPGSSTAAEWGLVCENKYKVGLVQALFFGGCMIGELTQFLCLRSLPSPSLSYVLSLIF